MAITAKIEGNKLLSLSIVDKIKPPSWYSVPVAAFGRCTVHAEVVGFQLFITVRDSTAIIVLDHNEEITARPSDATKMIFYINPNGF
jgi:hypothetical protein